MIVALRLTLKSGSSHGVLDLTGGDCNRVNNTHPDTLAQTFYLRPVATPFRVVLQVPSINRSNPERNAIQAQSLGCCMLGAFFSAALCHIPNHGAKCIQLAEVRMK